MRYLAMLMVAAGPAWADELAYDFRGAKVDEKLFRYDGPTPDKFLTSEKEGLRFRYSPGATPATAVGLTWRFPVRGDFAATAHFEILHVDQPRSGWGVGPEIWLLLDTPGRTGPQRDGVSVCRLVRPKEGAIFVYSHNHTNDAGKRLPRESKLVPTSERSLRGRMKLARTGPTLVASFAEGDQGPFKELHRTELGGMDVVAVRFAGITGNEPNASLDMRLLELRLENAELSQPALTGVAAGTDAGAPDSKRWVLRAAFASALLVLGVFVAVMLRRKSRARAAA